MFEVRRRRHPFRTYLNTRLGMYRKLVKLRFGVLLGLASITCAWASHLELVSKSDPLGAKIAFIMFFGYVATGFGFIAANNVTHVPFDRVVPIVERRIRPLFAVIGAAGLWAINFAATGLVTASALPIVFVATAAGIVLGYTVQPAKRLWEYPAADWIPGPNVYA